ncbi:Conserved hypothetical proetein [Pseudomonas syringae pv. maculicola]|nr:Conserved hypothetical proetein [Pseudomonas syringae pv. maculicola]
MLREESPGQSSLYLYEPGSYAPLARVDQKEGETENTIYYYHTDQIGTPLEMTDAEGHIVWQAKYRAWGAVEKLVVNEVEELRRVYPEVPNAKLQELNKFMCPERR